MLAVSFAFSVATGIPNEKVLIASTAFAGLLTVLTARSFVRADETALTVNFYGFRPTTMRWDSVRRVTFGMSWPSISLGYTLTDATGRRAIVHVNWWDQEARLVRVMLEHVVAGGAAMDEDVLRLARRILRKRLPQDSPRLVHRPLVYFARRDPWRVLGLPGAAIVILAVIALALSASPEEGAVVLLFVPVAGAIAAPLFHKAGDSTQVHLARLVAGLLIGWPIAAFTNAASAAGYALGYVLAAALIRGMRNSVADADSGDEVSARFTAEEPSDQEEVAQAP